MVMKQPNKSRGGWRYFCKGMFILLYFMKREKIY